jgi:hypothetical protein
MAKRCRISTVLLWLAGTSFVATAFTPFPRSTVPLKARRLSVDESISTENDGSNVSIEQSIKDMTVTAEMAWNDPDIKSEVKKKILWDFGTAFGVHTSHLLLRWVCCLWVFELAQVFACLFLY